MSNAAELIQRRLQYLDSVFYTKPFQFRAHRGIRSQSKSSPGMEILGGIAHAEYSLQANHPSDCFWCQLPEEGVVRRPAHLEKLFSTFPGISLKHFKELFTPRNFWTHPFNTKIADTAAKTLLELASWHASDRVIYELDWETFALLLATRLPPVQKHSPYPGRTSMTVWPQSSGFGFDGLLCAEWQPLMGTYPSVQKNIALTHVIGSEAYVIPKQSRFIGTITGLSTSYTVISPERKRAIEEADRRQRWHETIRLLDQVNEEASRSRVLPRIYLPDQEIAEGHQVCGCPACNSKSEKYNVLHFFFGVPYILGCIPRSEFPKMQPYASPSGSCLLDWAWVMPIRHQFKLLPAEQEALEAARDGQFGSLYQRFRPGSFRRIPESHREKNGPSWYWSRPTLIS